MTFSSGLKIGDLDDFLTPAQDCVVDLFNPSGTVDTSDRAPVVEEQPDLIKTQQGSEKATVSLSDCLACSGCVTSAETVLLEQQSFDEFLQKCSTAPLVVVSVSPQSLASLAQHFDLQVTDVLRRLRTVLRIHL